MDEVTMVTVAKVTAKTSGKVLPSIVGKRNQDLKLLVTSALTFNGF